MIGSTVNRRNTFLPRKVERVTINAYRERVKQCEELEEFAMAEHIREILLQEQEHLIDLSTALGENPPNVGRGAKQ